MYVLILSAGASACVELQKHEDAVRWSDDGLAVSFMLNIQSSFSRLCHKWVEGAVA